MLHKISVNFFSFSNQTWCKVNPKTLNQLDHGDEWLATNSEGVLLAVKVSYKRNMPLPLLRTNSGSVAKEQAAKYSFVARVHQAKEAQ